MEKANEKAQVKSKGTHDNNDPQNNDKGKAIRGKETDVASAVHLLLLLWKNKSHQRHVLVERVDIQHRPASGYHVTTKPQYQSSKTTMTTIPSIVSGYKLLSTSAPRLEQMQLYETGSFKQMVNSANATLTLDHKFTDYNSLQKNTTMGYPHRHRSYDKRCT
eukprot:6322245-Amphidinium_carterae.1